MSIDKQILVDFAPERWGTLDRFQKLHQETYKLDKHQAGALRGAANHFHKAVRLARVAEVIVPRMKEDRAELNEKGYTASERSYEFAAVVEALLLSLYSAVDCTRKVLKAAYPKAQGFPDSTRKLFANAKNGKLDECVPLAIRNTLASAEWFTEFRLLRDALTHSDSGSCHLDSETGKISYFNEVFRGFREPSYIEDFMSYINQRIADVNTFMASVFAELNRTLNEKEVWIICGIFYGRIFSRYVRPSEATHFGAGRCDAYTWFEKDENPNCPFMDRCGAYKQRHQNNQGETKSGADQLAAASKPKPVSG